MSTAQSEVVGLLLIFSITFISITVILLTGLPIIDSATENTQLERFQNEFAILDQAISESVYAPGQSGASVSLSDGRVSVDDGSDSMTVKITYRPNGSAPVSTREIHLGSVEFDADGDRGVAYEGGGVWGKYRGGGLSMRTPPDISYSGNTLNMDLMNFTTEVNTGGDGTRIFVFSSEGTYRSSEIRSITDSPLRPGELEISVRSNFAEAWAEYFNRAMASSTVEVETASSPDERSFANVTFSTGPPLYGIENALNHSGDSSNEVDINSGGVNVTDTRIGDIVLSNYTKSELDSNMGPTRGVFDLPDTEAVCFRRFDGEDLASVSYPVTSGDYTTDNSDEISGEEFVANGGDLRVYADTSLTLDGTDTTTFDTSGGNVEVHVDGSLTLNGDIEIEGENAVYFYSDGDITVAGSTTVSAEDGRSERLQLFTSGRADVVGSADYNGTVYAQEKIALGSNVEFVGAAVTPATLDIGDADYTHDTSLRGKAPDCADEPLRNFNAVERRVAVR